MLGKGKKKWSKERKYSGAGSVVYRNLATFPGRVMVKGIF